MPRLLGLGLVLAIYGALLAPPAHSDPAAQQLFEHKELVLSGYQKETIRVDLPARAIATDGRTGTVAILGRTSLWLWQVERQALSRVKLISPTEARAHRLSHLIAVGDGDWAILGDRALFRVNLTPRLKVLRFDHPGYLSGRTVGHGVGGDELWWLHSDGIGVLKLSSNVLTQPFPQSVVKAGDRGFADPTSRQVFLARGAHIIRKDLNYPDASPHLIHKGIHAFSDLAPLAGDLLVRTTRTVLRLAPTGALRQAIPVEGKRSLVAMSVRGSDHGYVFHDGLLEVYRTGDQSTAKYRLDLSAHSQIHRLALDGPLGALIIDGEPRVFLLF